MTALWGEVGRPGASATDTSASSAIALTRASLDAVARTSAATEVNPGLAGRGREELSGDRRDAAFRHLRSGPICRALTPPAVQAARGVVASIFTAQTKNTW